METVLLKIRRKKTVMELREIIIPILQEKADRAAAVTPVVRDMPSGGRGGSGGGNGMPGGNSGGPGGGSPGGSGE